VAELSSVPANRNKKPSEGFDARSEGGEGTALRAGFVSLRQTVQVMLPPAESPPNPGIEPALGGMLEEPANYKFSFLDLDRPLVLGGQFVIHAINLGSAYLGEQAHCGVKLIQRTDDEAAAMNVGRLPKTGSHKRERTARLKPVAEIPHNECRGGRCS
jgi:hypothetical protein